MNQNSINKLKNKIKMKKNTILIIANGSSVLSYEYGALINTFENVARINNYSISKHDKYIGDKIDIWFNGANQGLKKRKILDQQQVVVFVPLLIVQVEAGQLFRDISVAICVAITLSLILAITLIPVISSKLQLLQTDNKKKFGNLIIQKF